MTGFWSRAVDDPVIVEVPRPVGYGRTAGDIPGTGQQAVPARGLVHGKPCNRDTIGHKDVSLLRGGVRPVGVRDGQIDRVVAWFGINHGGVPDGTVDDSVVIEIPRPPGDVLADRGIGELDRNRCDPVGRVCSKTGYGGKGRDRNESFFYDRVRPKGVCDRQVDRVVARLVIDADRVLLGTCR